jgi:hypothetical protein
MKRRGGNTVFQNRKESRGYEGHDPFDPFLMKPESQEDFSYVLLVELIKRLGHIQLDEHARGFCGF